MLSNSGGMKKSSRIALLFILLTFLAIPLHAADVSDLTYDASGPAITITDCDEAASGELVIPDTIEGKPVTEEMTEMSYKQIFTAFHQDWEVFNKQQENWDDRPTIDTIQDAGSIAARAMIDRAVAEEQGEMAVAAE